MYVLDQHFLGKYQGNIEGKYPFYKVSDMNLTGNLETLMCSSKLLGRGRHSLKPSRQNYLPKDTVIFPKVGAARITRIRNGFYLSKVWRTTT